MWKYLKLNFFHKIPVILQTESAECGLACLSMILNYYDDRSGLFSLRQKYHISTKGSTLNQLIEIAKDSGLMSRALSLELEELNLLRLPCILHWQFNHFVTLVSVKDNHYIIHDPAFGRKKVTLKEMDAKFTGIALEIYPSVNFRPNKNKQKKISFKEIFVNLSGIKSYLIKILSLSVFIELINLMIPIGTQLITDHVIKSKDESLLLIICIGLFIFYIFNTITELLREWLHVKIDNLIGLQWETSFFAHLLKLPLDFFERRNSGDIQSRFNSLDLLHKTLNNSIVSGLIGIVIVISLLFMMILYGSWLTALVVFFTLIYFSLRIATYIIYKQASEEELIKSAKANSYFIESIYGISSVKALGINEIRQQYWSSLTVDHYNASIKIKKLDMLFSSIHSFINSLEQILILGLGVYMVMQNSMTLGMFVAFNAYRGSFSGKTAELIDLIFNLKMLSLHTERIMDIAFTEKETEVYHHLDYTQNNKASLTIDGLSFQYDRFSKPLFYNVSFTINSGESVALIAPSGFGKTTLLKIMCGLLTPSAGQVLFNETDIQKLGINHYRKQIACVLQDDKLFSGSIIENIIAFNKEIDQSSVFRCAKLAQIHDEIMAMPMGYETIIGELGSTLSGGQKQRLIIARALYKNPKILFLDEATSHLDIANEQKINTAIAELKITRVIVAHRPSTIASADRVIDLSAI